MKLKYQAVLNDLENKIVTGIWPEGVMIPTELELCDKYGVSRITIRRALDEMTRAGMIERARGRGTFVRGARKISDHHTSGVDPIGDEDDHPITSKVIQDLEYSPDSDIAVNLLPQFNIPRESYEALHRIQLLTSINDTPYAVQNIFLPASIAEAIDRKELTEHPFLKVCGKVTGISLSKVESSIATIVPDRETSDLLGTHPSAAQLWKKSRLYGEDGTLIAINYTVYDGNLFEYNFSVDLTGSSS